MTLIKKILKLSGTGFTYGQYYESMNMALKKLNNEYTMLHYPLFVNENDSFMQAQKNLTDYCISLLNPLKDKDVLEIGCGNGVQALYILKKWEPLNITGIDLSEANIAIALAEKDRTKAENAHFMVDNAQDLMQIPDNSVDILLNIESAFHYPDKAAFLREIQRVLKPGGQFLVADILSTYTKREGMMKVWGKPMVHHFWTKSKYNTEFSKTDLIISKCEDISPRVVKGWSLYKNWIPKIKREGFFLNLALRMFYIINARLNIYFLKKRQMYCIFAGYNGKAGPEGAVKSA